MLMPTQYSVCFNKSLRKNKNLPQLYIFIYDDQLRVIAITIGAQDQQVNLTLNFGWSCIARLQDWRSYFIA